MHFPCFRQLGILTLMAALNVNVASAAVPGLAEARCDTWGDSLEQGDQTKIRVDFALSCEQNRKLKAEIRRHFTEGVGRSGSTVKTAGYPTYGYYDPNKEDYTNPNHWFAPPKTGGDCSIIPSGYEIAYFCASGCYAPEEGVLFLSGYEPIVKAMKSGKKEIQSLDPESTSDDPKLVETKVVKYVTDVKAGKQEILTFVMKSGGSLRVTKNHPLVDGQGYIRQAVELKTGDTLMKADGTADPIASISEKVENTKVYNLAIDAPSSRGQIVVAQGYLNGTLYFQNEGVKELNRLHLRTVTMSHFIPN